MNILEEIKKQEQEIRSLRDSQYDLIIELLKILQNKVDHTCLVNYSNNNISINLELNNEHIWNFTVKVAQPFNSNDYVEDTYYIVNRPPDKGLKLEEVRIKLFSQILPVDVLWVVSANLYELCI